MIRAENKVAIAPIATDKKIEKSNLGIVGRSTLWKRGIKKIPAKIETTAIITFRIVISTSAN